jgi:hypothetical protein
LGTIKLAVGGASVSLQDIQKIEKEHKDKRLLIVIVDDKASVYELGKGNKIDLDIEFNNKLFKKINIKNKINDGDESVIVKLVSVPNNLNASNSGAPSITSPPSICLTNDRTFVAAETQRFIVSICGQDNPTYYVGTAKGETDSIKLRLNSSSSGQHIAKNGNTSYIVERGYLTVLEDDRVLVKEKIIRSQWN